MDRFFYPRLAVDNIRKNAQTYLPYLLTCICAVSMYYIVTTLSLDPNAGNTTSIVLALGSRVMLVFSVIFLFYTNSFLLKRRKKEFGLYAVLGMERRHIARILFYETLAAYLLSLVVGLALGLGLYKLVHLFLLALLKFDIRFGYFLSTQAIGQTLKLFTAIFIMLFLSSLWQIARVQPIEMMREAQSGEREPKARWLIALVGLLCLGAGYWISISTKDPMAVMVLFFFAVILVIVGTYLLFTAGGVALLKILKRNKNYYYKPNHFISVSGMMFRMKQNAAGLATICILATMVLVMISSTTALYFGMEDSLDSRYPRQLYFQYSNPEEGQVATVDEVMRRSLEEQGLEAQNRMAYRVLPIFGTRNGQTLVVDGLYDTSWEMMSLSIIPQEDYNSFAEQPVQLAEGHALLLPDSRPYGGDRLTLLGTTYEIEETAVGLIDTYPLSRAYNTDPTPTYTLVVPGMADLELLQRLYNAREEESTATLRYLIGFDLVVEEARQSEAGRSIAVALGKAGYSPYFESRAENKSEFFELYGGLFFLGLFLGFVFLIATVLIIYYKQVSEGYDDQRRHAIMQKVGLSKRESRRAISSQILTMFFLPLVTACVHIAFAYPAIVKILYVLNLHNEAVFRLSTLLSAAVFALFYFAIYTLTAKVYYRIVEAGR